jgi:hypothetical protein
MGKARLLVTENPNKISSTHHRAKHSWDGLPWPSSALHACAYK